MNIVFLIASVIAIFATIMVITRHNAIHALLYLVLSLLSVALIFFISGAPYAAALEIIVYAGAIMILFVFVVMMLNINSSIKDEKSITSWKMWILPVILFLILVFDFIYAVKEEKLVSQSNNLINSKQVGVSLFTTYLLGTELAGILLLAAIIGAYHLGKTKKRNLHRYLQTNSDSENLEI